VLAALVKDRENHQVRIREKALPSFGAGRFRSAHESPEMLVLRQAAQMFQANASQTGNFVLGKELLARLDSDHARLSPFWMLRAS
jgi:hypothetical protein